MCDFLKYPRTPHLFRSRKQHGDDLNDVPFDEIKGKYLVLEEKLDASQCGLSFSEDGKLQLQSRGHYLTGGARERQFNLFKTWASSFSGYFYEVLGCRYIVFAEWMFAKHTIFYDALLHYFMEFDIYDRQADKFLSTPRRQELLDYIRLYVPVVSVPVLATGCFNSLEEITPFVRRSLYKTEQWQDSLKKSAEKSGTDIDKVLKQTNMSDLAEGLYVKWENDDEVLGRYKWVRDDFVSTILDSDSHWMNRPIVPNMLADGVDIFRC